MNNEFYKNILENIDLPVCVKDDSGNIVYNNSPQTDFSACVQKDIELNGKKYKLLAGSDISQSHQDFVSTVSHELRTPLTSIRGFADTMIASSDKLSKEQQNKFLSIIRNQADRLTRLVENLLEVSNISKKSKLIFKEINFKSFVSPIITIFERKYPNRNYKVVCDDKLPDVWADSDILEQIMTNLIDNASKYSYDNTTVIVEAKFLNNDIIIKVIDEGVNIPESQLDKIFGKFSRIDNPLTRKVEGSGLGLFITKALAEKLNGSIKAENYDKGAIFTLTLQSVSVEKQLGSKILGDKN